MNAERRTTDILKGEMKRRASRSEALPLNTRGP
jgi:hypothetical protein